MVSSSWLKGIAALLAGVLPLYWQPGLEAAQNSIMLPREAIPAITNPAFVSAEQASFWMDEAEGVIGLDIGRRRESVPHQHAESSRDSGRHGRWSGRGRHLVTALFFRHRVCQRDRRAGPDIWGFRQAHHERARDVR